MMAVFPELKGVLAQRGNFIPLDIVEAWQEVAKKQKKSASGTEASDIVFEKINDAYNNPLISAIREFSKQSVAIFGTSSLDIHERGMGSGLGTEEPYIKAVYLSQEIVPGGASNAALNMRTIGNGLVFPIDIIKQRHIASRRLRSIFKKKGINLDGLVDGDRIVHTYRYSHVGSGGSHGRFNCPLRFEEGNKGRIINGGEEDAILDSAKRLFEEYRLKAFFVSDYGKGDVTENVCQGLRQIANERGIIIAGNPRYNPNWQRNFDLMIINDSEAYAANYGRPYERGQEESIAPAEVEEMGRSLIEKLGVERLVITMGGNGSYVFERNKLPKIAPPDKRAKKVDIIGAGDSFSAACVLGVAAGASTYDAARIGNYAGAEAIEHQGTYAVRQPELTRRILVSEC